ncbi:MAG: phosphotransferase [bacterium]|nr:phosphotransferase [bacterium]
MEDIDLVKISAAVSAKLGEPIEFVDIQKIGSGYHSAGYKITAKDGRAFFLKKVTATTIGLEHPERRLSSLLVGHNMAKRSGQLPRPVGLLLEVDGEVTTFPDIPLNSNVFHLQEFEPEGTNYFSLLESRKEKAEVDERDRVETTNMVAVIAAIHAIRYSSDDAEHIQAVYMDGLRGELVHPELTLTFMHQLDETHPIVPPSKQGEYIEAYLQLIHRWKGRTERLRALHGDLWGANVFVRQNGTAWIIDFSRIPWGDPGIDVGRWMGQYMWFYLVTKNEYFKNLGELFLETYIEKTGDKEIYEAASLGYVFTGFIYATAFEDESVELRKKMFAHATEILKQGKFFWPELD